MSFFIVFLDNFPTDLTLGRVSVAYHCVSDHFLGLKDLLAIRAKHGLILLTLSSLVLVFILTLSTLLCL